MAGMCVGKGIVIEKKFIFGLFGYKTRGSCVYNVTAEKQGNFRSFIAWDIAYKLMS